MAEVYAWKQKQEDHEIMMGIKREGTGMQTSREVCRNVKSISVEDKTSSKEKVWNCINTNGRKANSNKRTVSNRMSKYVCM
jgi:hypothetical protein